MRAKAGTLIIAALVFVAEPALAHPPPLGLGGFWGGALHPMFVADHAMAIVALGFLIGKEVRPAWLAVATFTVALGAGLIALTFGTVPSRASDATLALAAIAGLLVALGHPSPWLGLILAVSVGLAIGLDSPPEVISVSEANRMLIGTGIGAAALLTAVFLAAYHARARWMQIGIRILGSWIAAGAILALALRLVR